jgi:CSLREA domain-containing protein
MTRSRISIVIIALIFLATQSGLVVAAPEAPGATIIVNTTADELDSDPSDDTCSLREALQSAGNNMAVGGCAAGDPGADTITLPSGIYYLEITGSDDANQVGDFDIASEVTINGGNISGTIIDGSHLTGLNQDRLFHIVNSTGRLILNDLTLQYGSSMEHGGAIYNEGGYVRLVNAALLYNVAPGYGGAYATTPNLGTGAPELYPDHLLAAGPTLDCMGCYFQYNTAGWDGGAIFSYAGRLMMDTGYFEENSADAGGAILVDAGQNTTIHFSSFINNSAASFNGGAISIDHGLNSVSIEGTGFLGNTAVNNGGAIYIQRGTINISDSAFRQNEGGQGGGAIFTTSDANLVLDQVEITRNSSLDVGGGMLLYGSLDATNVTLSNNLSHERGAGLYVDSDEKTVSLAFSTIAFNLDEDLVNDGDGIWASNGEVMLEANILAFNGPESADGHNCGGNMTSFRTDGYNIETGKTCNLDYTEDDLIYTDPRLGSLGVYGALNYTQTHNLLFNSPAIDFYAGYDCPSIDQRGFDRPRDGGSGSAECDSGAYEANRPVLFLPQMIRP